jgi:hypothetical protein
MNTGHQNDWSGASSAKSSGEAAEWTAVQEEIRKAGATATKAGRDFTRAAAEEASSYMQQRKGAVADMVADLARSMREACGSMRDRPNIMAFSESAAEGLDHLAARIRQQDFPELYRGIELAARRHPAALAGAGVFAGFLLARFIKSSAEGIRQAEFDRRRGQRGTQASPASDYARGRM